MTITNIVKRVNARLKYDNYTYDELQLALDAAIDKLNTEWRVHVPLITNTPEFHVERPTVPGGRETVIANTYKNLPDEIIRMYVVPYAAGYQYMLSDVDGTIEMQEATSALARLSERYQINVRPGTEVIEDANYDLLSEDYSDQFANGHDNYGYEEGIEGSSINPLEQ